MTLIKGFVLMSRFDYLEKNAGKDAIKKFLTRIKQKLEDYARQPVIGSNNYPQSSIAKIDNILLEDYFGNDLEEFRKPPLMPISISEKQSAGVLQIMKSERYALYIIVITLK